MTKPARYDWKRTAARHFLLHTVDMTVAILGFVYGFGIEVKNWWAVIGLMLLTRWVTSVVMGAAYFKAARDQLAESEGAKQ